MSNLQLKAACAVLASIVLILGFIVYGQTQATPTNDLKILNLEAEIVMLKVQGEVADGMIDSLVRFNNLLIKDLEACENGKENR